MKFSNITCIKSHSELKNLIKHNEQLKLTVSFFEFNAQNLKGNNYQESEFYLIYMPYIRISLYILMITLSLIGNIFNIIKFLANKYQLKMQSTFTY